MTVMKAAGVFPRYGCWGGKRTPWHSRNYLKFKDINTGFKLIRLTPEIWSLRGEIKADAIELSDQIPITTHEGIGISQFEIRN